MPNSSVAARVAWLNERLALGFIHTSRTWIDEDLISALLVAGVLSANVEPAGVTPAHFAEGGALPDELRRPINAMSVAQSLGIANETARGKLARLVDSGTLQRAGDGFILSAATVASPPLGQAMRAFVGAIAAFAAGLADVRACGMDGAGLAPPSPALGGLAVRLCTAHVLRGIDHARSLHPSIGLPGLYVLLALGHIVGTSLRLPPDDPRAAEGLSPAPGRAPVTVADLARFTGMPHETLRRQVLKLQTAGLVLREGHRCDLALTNPVVVGHWTEMRDQTMARADQLVGKLRLAGIIIDKPEQR